MNWCDRLENHWKDQGVQSLEPRATETDIKTFETEYSIQLPAEYRLYFEQLNGMSTRGGHDMCDNLFSFLPLNRVASVADFALAKDWKVRGVINPKTTFVFVDYLHLSSVYAFETAQRDCGAVYLLAYEVPTFVAPSLERFIELYLSDDPLLYPAKPR